jgi:hypothetical protein
MTDVTPEAFVQAVRDVVAEKGREFVYDRPTRVNDGEPASCLYSPTDEYPHACLFGTALARLGYSVPTRFEGEGIDTVLTELFGWTYTVRNDRILKAASRAQSLQDTGHPWGAALDRFESVIIGLQAD